MWTKTFLVAALERALKTGAQSAIVLLLAGGDSLGLHNAPWLSILSIAGMAAVLSVLTSVASGIDGSGPSLGGAEVLSEQGATAEPPTGPPVEVVVDTDPLHARDDNRDGRPDYTP